MPAELTPTNISTCARQEIAGCRNDYSATIICSTPAGRPFTILLLRTWNGVNKMLRWEMWRIHDVKGALPQHFEYFTDRLLTFPSKFQDLFDETIHTIIQKTEFELFQSLKHNVNGLQFRW